MSNLAEVFQQIKEEIKIDASGKGKASIRAVSRLADVSFDSIRKSLVVNTEIMLTTKTPNKALNLTEILMERGFTADHLNSWLKL